MEVEPVVSVSKMLQQSIQSALDTPAGGEAPGAGQESAGESAGETSVEAAAAENTPEQTKVTPEVPEVDPGTVVQSAKPVPDLDKRLEKLSQSSNKLISERQKFAEERKAFEKDLADLKQWKEIIGNAKQDPVSFAELAGFEPDQFATVLLDRGALSPERKRLVAAEQRMKSLEDQLSQRDQRQAQMSIQAQRAAVLSQLQDFTRSKPEEYEMVNAWGQHEAVLQEIEQHYQKTFDSEVNAGETLTYDDAAGRVEARLVDKYLNPILKSSKLRKLSDNVAPDSTSPAIPSAPARKTTGTITSKMRAAPSTPAKEELSEAERFQKAGELIMAQMMGRR